RIDRLKLRSGRNWGSQSVPRPLREQRLGNGIGAPCKDGSWVRDIASGIRYHYRGSFPQQKFVDLPRLSSVACAPREFRLISRYTREEMGRVWSEEGKFRR